MTEIQYVTGDATQPQGDGLKYIIHCCNDVGGWGAGFVLALSRRWKEPERQYRKIKSFELGAVQVIPVEEDILVCNIIGQRGHDPSLRPVRYDALLKGFDLIASFAKVNEASIHAPRLGCGLAGGDWRVVEALLQVAFTDEDVPVTIYDLPGR